MSVRVGLLALLIAAGAAHAADRTSVTTPDYEFQYSYPSQAEAIAPLRAWLDADRDQLQAGVAKDSAEGRKEAEAPNAGFPFHPYAAEKEWKVVADTPRFLSLSASLYSFSGGAHGMTTSGSMLWDRKAEQRLEPEAVFRSPAALQAAIGPAVCERLKEERRKRVGSEADAAGDIFDKCPPLGDLTLLLGSSGGGRINRVGFIADPYVAGAYVEGSYEVTLPVTVSLLDVVKPDYRDAFALR